MTASRGQLSWRRTVDIPGRDRLRPYQRDAAELLASGQRQGLWVGTGLGKTATLLAAWYDAGLPFPLLIVTRASGRHVWPRDAKWVLGHEFLPSVLRGGSVSTPGVHRSRFGTRTYTSLDLALRDSVVVVTNYDILRQRHAELTAIPWRGLILDEVHEVRGGYKKPQRRRDGSIRLFRYHILRDIARRVRWRGGVVWSATATPVIDRRRDLFAQIDLVAPGAVGSAWDFLHRFCDAKPGPWGGLITDGVSNTEELQAIVDRLFCRIRRSDVADQLPTVTRSIETLSVDHQNMKHAGGSVETALLRAAEMKVDFVLEKVAEYLTGRLKIVVCFTRREIVHRVTSIIEQSKKFQRSLPRHVRESLNVKAVTGEVPVIERQEIVGRFNELPTGPAVLVATMDSIRESVDLQQTDGVIIGALPYSPGSLYQFEGRFNRLGGRPVTIHYPIVAGTIDESYRELVLEKMEDIEGMRAQTQGHDSAYDALRYDNEEEEIMRALAADLARLDED